MAARRAARGHPMMYVLAGMVLASLWNWVFFPRACTSLRGARSNAPAAYLDVERRRHPTFKLVSAQRHHLQVLLGALHDRGYSEVGTPGPEWGAIIRESREWDLLWSFGYPRFSALGPLSRHHRVNHLPGLGVITVKSSMWSAYKARRTALAAMGVDVGRQYTWVPPHFVLGAELGALERAMAGGNGSGGGGRTKSAANSGTARWLLKRQSHRGIRLISSKEDARAAAKQAGVSGAAVFAAAYVPPLLLDGRKWDIGMYVVVTSVDPLRVWVHGNALLRFCKLPYPAGGAVGADTPLDAYVVNDYLPPWEQPSLRAAFHSSGASPSGGGVPDKVSQGANSLDAVVAWMRKQPGLERAAAVLRTELQRAIVLAMAEAQPAIRRGAARWSPRWGRRAFFELLRFDFVLDESGQPWLMEVNMSPNLVIRPSHAHSCLHAACALLTLSPTYCSRVYASLARTTRCPTCSAAATMRG